MTRITFAALLLSACTAPDWCHVNRHEVETCLELQRLDQTVECQCQTRTSGKVEPTVIVTPPDDDDGHDPCTNPRCGGEPPPTGCDGGHDQNCDGVGGDPVKGGK